MLTLFLFSLEYLLIPQCPERIWTKLQKLSTIPTQNSKNLNLSFFQNPSCKGMESNSWKVQPIQPEFGWFRHCWLVDSTLLQLGIWESWFGISEANFLILHRFFWNFVWFCWKSSQDTVILKNLHCNLTNFGNSHQRKRTFNIFLTKSK